MKKITIPKCSSLEGSVSIPGDKSISHRALIFASIAQGTSRLKNLLSGHDCLATVQMMRSLGVHIALKDDEWVIHAFGKEGLKEPSSILDCKNSGTTIRLMAGLLSAMPFLSIIDGTDQIKSRPMDRVIAPLKKMGANIFGRANDTLAPLVLLPAPLHGTSIKLTIKSAQIKSAIILAGLFSKGETIISNISHTRDHSENLLQYMGAQIKKEEDELTISPLKKSLEPINMNIPGDMSSAAFLIAAGILLADPFIKLKRVSINKTRMGFIDALKMMGASIQIENQKEVANEVFADIIIHKSSLKSARFFGNHIVRMIDEIPILALLATQAHGTTIIKDASELKVKESNRISKTSQLLNMLGAHVEESNDGMIIKGPTKIKGGNVSSFFDHRLAMVMAIAGLISKEGVTVSNAQVIDDSFPSFLHCLKSLGAQVIEE